MTAKAMEKAASGVFAAVGLTMQPSFASEPAALPSVAYLPDGTTHIQNLDVPIPATISPEATAMIVARNAAPDITKGLTAPVTEMRAVTDGMRQKVTAALLKRFPVTVTESRIAGITVRLVTPARRAVGRDKDLLINVHGGAFMLGAGSFTEAIPIAALSGIPVLAIDYRLAPENPFPAAVDDTIAVYHELLKTHDAKHLALYGSSAGAVLTAQASVRARQLGLPLPAALGFFSGTTDFARPGDTEALFGVLGFAQHVTPVADQAVGYLKGADRHDPVLSPIYANLAGFPPTLCMSGTRDFFMSGTSNFHRALLRAGVPAELVVFDAMPHVHWEDPSLPESAEAWGIQADFLSKHLARD